MPLNEAEVHYGTAYKILYERWDPDGRATPEAVRDLAAKRDAVVAWANTQSEPTRTAYLRAAEDIFKRAEGIAENNARARQMHELSRTIARPPE